MKKSVIIGAAVLAAAAGGVVYLTDDSTAPPPAKQTTKSQPSPAGTAPSSAAVPSRSDVAAIPPDPRLAKLQVSPDNPLIKFVVGGNGKVIAEIDQDPASASYGKPTREYLYFGDKVVRLTEYRYMRDRVEVTRTLVAYKPDGSVEDVKTVLETN